MYSAYTPRECIPLQANLPIERPEELPELVHFHDPAMLVLTDFSRVFPVTITADRPIDYALQKMKNSGIRLLIVVNRKHHMTGLISADKIMGDARVGHIVATLHQLEQKYLLVVDNGVVCGLFSASQISKQLGRNIHDEETPAHSLAEMVHSIG